MRDFGLEVSAYPRGCKLVASPEPLAGEPLPVVAGLRHLFVLLPDDGRPAKAREADVRAAADCGVRSPVSYLTTDLNAMEKISCVWLYPLSFGGKPESKSRAASSSTL